MKHLIKATVTNERTGDTGIVRGVWWNEYAGQWILNVTIVHNRRAASWTLKSVGGAA